MQVLYIYYTGGKPELRRVILAKDREASWWTTTSQKAIMAAFLSQTALRRGYMTLMFTIARSIHELSPSHRDAERTRAPEPPPYPCAPAKKDSLCGDDKTATRRQHERPKDLSPSIEAQNI